ncbi:MAG: hypothetical protein Q8Q42_02385 [Nanoarchaeota archaeon]|nr:hypothetical protein [Nanoarchaeota archaeon]
MTIHIPRRKIETKRETIVRLPDGHYAFPNQIAPFQTDAVVNLEDYALIKQGSSAECIISMKQELGVLNSFDANREALRRGLFIPPLALFMPHYRNVNLSQQGKGVIYDATGKIITGYRLHDYSTKINTECWVSLNDYFFREAEGGFLDLTLCKIIGFDDENNPIFKKSPLEKCLEKDCWADLESLNQQGLPTKESPIMLSEAGKSIFFHFPKHNSVARFGADSNGIYLNCFRDPQYLNSDLGVFLATAGTKKI